MTNRCGATISAENLTPYSSEAISI